MICDVRHHETDRTVELPFMGRRVQACKECAEWFNNERDEEIMSENQKHTPGPWAYSTSPQPNGCPIIGSSGLMVCMLSHSVNEPSQKEIAIANAERIVACVNALEGINPASVKEMRDALKKVMLWIENWSPNFCDDPYWKADEAFAKSALANSRL